MKSLKIIAMFACFVGTLSMAAHSASADMVRVDVSQTKAIAGRTADIFSQMHLLCSGHAYSRILDQIRNSDEIHIDRNEARIHLVRNDILAPGKKREFADVQTDATFTKIISVRYRQETLTQIYTGPINHPTVQLVWAAPSTTECLPPEELVKHLIEPQLALPAVAPLNVP